MEWVYLATAPDQVTGEIWVELLRAEAVEARLDPGDTASFLGVSPRPVRLLVRASHVARGREILGPRGLEADE